MVNFAPSQRISRQFFHLRSQRGQIAVETVLLIALSVGVFLMVSSKFREGQYFAQILSKPWTNVASMIQNGVWEKKYLHPVQHDRWISVKGDPP